VTLHPKVYAANLARAWGTVEETDIALGARAYHDYHDTLRAFARLYGTPFVSTVEAFCILSPANDYHGNLRSLATVQFAVATGTPISGYEVSTFRRFRDAAHDYLSGEASFLDRVKGNKVRAFRHNLLYPDTSKRVTIDGHMVAILTGQRLTMKDANLELRNHGYAPLEAAVRRFSRQTGMTPPALQAVLWTARKRRERIMFSTQSDLFTGNTLWNGALDPLQFPPYALPEWRAWLKSRMHLSARG